MQVSPPLFGTIFWNRLVVLNYPFSSSGVPPGVFNLVNGDGNGVGHRLYITLRVTTAFPFK